MMNFTGMGIPCLGLRRKIDLAAIEEARKG